MINITLNQRKQDIVHGLLYDSKELLKKEEYQLEQVNYVLINNNEIKSSIVSITDKNMEMYEVILKNKEINQCQDWAYSIDSDIFYHLENEYEIGFMSMEMHSAIWQEIDEAGIEEYRQKLGLQKYLKYCKDNNIDQKTICEKTNVQVPDLMQYYDEKVDYLKIENGQVQIPQDKYQKESEISYIAFCLGYDLLHDKLSNSEHDECDNVYDFCNYLANKFFETDYYKNEWKSTYDNLQEWLEDNKEIIQSEYLHYFNLDNKHILEIGNRGGTKVALVEHCFKDETKEYIVAFHYKVDDKKLDWGYGYYYDNNLEKAKADFEKVKAGGNLADTFKEESKKKYKERER